MKLTTARPQPVTAPAAPLRLFRCGGRTCPPGTCNHDDTVTRPATTAGPSTAPPIVDRVLRRGGAPLPAGVRADAERRLGADFAAVRVHTDGEAAQSAAAVSARAYAVGRHVVFGDGAYAPETADGRRVLLHELVHTMQQAHVPDGPVTGAPVSSPDDAAEQTAERVASRGPRAVPADDELQTVRRTPTVQRDLAIAPPQPRAEGRTLTAPQMQDAIRFDTLVVGVIGPAGIAELRDVLGVSRDPSVIDEDFVNAVVRWQAMQGLRQDGKLGPATARPLFREIGAEGVGRGEVKTGPTYAPGGTFAPPVDGAGEQHAHFNMSADFRDDPANGIFAACCEVRQFIQWDAAAAAVMGGGRPHRGFPAGTAAGTWIEDRDNLNQRYGHRAGPFSDPEDFDQYVDSTPIRNQAFGDRYRGNDTPGGGAAGLAGTWRFLVEVVDVCNGGARIGGQDFIRINW
jgi:hypothetical protein